MILNGQIVTAVSIGGQVVAKRGLPGAKGDKGDTGDTGATGNGISSAILNQDYTLTLNFTNGTSYTTPSIRGQQGATGSTGATGNGISNCVLNADYTLTITFTNGTSYTTPSIRGQQGETGATGATGQKGDTGNSGVYVGTTQPTDPDVNVWIDETGTGIELYTKSETDALLGGKANTSHNHTKSQITDFAHTHNDLYYGKSEVDTALSGKQATLVSGTNIKTINNTPILGSGDITVSAEDEIFVAFYDPTEQTPSTSYADVLAAYNAGKHIVCKIVSDDGYAFFANFAKYSDGFHFAFSNVSEGSINTAYFELSSSGWTRSSDHMSPYTKPSSGIPKTDLASAVQTSLTKADTALQSVPNTYRTSADQDVIDSGKVDKVEGKGLSTNDYTTAEKTKLSGIEANADVTDNLNVKDALTDSSASAWADADKKACCGTIGAVYDGQYELIEEITLTEGASEITRSQDPDGVAYDFQDIEIIVASPDSPSDGVMLGYVSGRIAFYSKCLYTSSGGFGVFRASTRGGLLHCISGGSNNNPYGSTISNWQNYVGGNGYAMNAISSFSLSAYSTSWASQNLPIGTTIKIYAIRN